MLLRPIQPPFILCRRVIEDWGKSRKMRRRRRGIVCSSEQWLISRRSRVRQAMRTGALLLCSSFLRTFTSSYLWFWRERRRRNAGYIGLITWRWRKPEPATVTLGWRISLSSNERRFTAQSPSTHSLNFVPWLATSKTSPALVLAVSRHYSGGEKHRPTFAVVLGTLSLPPLY